MTIGGKTVVAGAVAGAAILGTVGGSMMNSLTANADSVAPVATTAATTSTTTAPPGNMDPSRGGHTANGITEQVLTGDSATKATAAATAAEPGATVIRAETDAEGAAYEVHMKKSDGSTVTVKLDSSYKVTGTETGFGGPGPSGANAPQ